jgi:hypothetical protein
MTRLSVQRPRSTVPCRSRYCRRGEDGLAAFKKTLEAWPGVVDSGIIDCGSPSGLDTPFVSLKDEHAAV